ncbi:MAG: NAD(P)H-hydrate dehydratase [Clostridia bacterium]|nr:NAD(P)H-hydrate dehydratase [Clostridia bacterium]
MSYTLDKVCARGLLPHRDDTQAKWQFGRTMLVCGSAAMPGAALMAGEAALRSGAGLVQLCSVEEVIQAARVRLPEALLFPVDRQDERLPGAIHKDAAWSILPQAEKAQSLLFGPGVAITDHGRKLLKWLVQEYKGALVIDADGLNLLAENTALLYKVSGRCLLTPHWGEFCRLTGLSRERLESDPAGAAMAFARQYNCVVALKGAVTHITDGQRRYVLDCPNSGMAKGGSGDVLAGLTAGLCALRPQSLLENAALAVWLHSRAGQLARERQGAFAMLPRDVLACLGAAFLELEASPL